MSKKRKWLFQEQAELLGKTVKPNEKNRNQARYYVSEDEEGILEAAKESKISSVNVKHLWKKNKKESVFVTNPNYIPPQTQNVLKVVEETFNNVLLRHNNIKKVQIPSRTNKTSKKALKVTISDDHVGLEPNPNDKGLFKYEYNAKIYKKSYDKVFESILKEYDTHGKFDVIYLDNLGDEQDGWNGYTTRGGHKLPQNMNNTEVFETCLDTKLLLIMRLIESNISNKIVVGKVANDNHSGDMGHIVNLALKKLTDLMFTQEIVKVETYTRFLEHRFYGKHCHILTHGKDSDVMFKGLPLQLNDKTINYINNYIKHYNITSEFIHVEKGDLHQIGYNKCMDFDYRNFMSFAPPSNWVMHNFGNSYSGYSIQVIPSDNNEISHTDYFLDYKRKTQSV